MYERAGGQTTLLSAGSVGGDEELDASFLDASADGARILVETDESLVSADTDTRLDVYERAGGQTTLLSTGPDGGNGEFGVEFQDASDDAGRVFFDTREPLVSADTDAQRDIYERAGGQTTLLSTGPDGGNGDSSARFEGTSDDGSHVFLETLESLLSSDTDPAFDVYDMRIAAPPNPSSPPAPGTGGVPAPAAAPSAPAGPLPGACANVRSGTAGIDRLTGGAFGDRLLGLAGEDVLIGRAGDDCLSGGRGNDRLRGLPGDDRLDGGHGKDALNGGRGKDTVGGGRGNDIIDSRDGRRETVRCGKGSNDRVRADRSDKLIGCEHVRRF